MTVPTIDELAIGAFLHDIGKLGQRAASEEALPDYVRGNEAEWLPPLGGGRYGYRHVLFTEAFFDRHRGHLPAGIDAERARVSAVYHHKPDDARPWTWIVTEADRMASGMDRKEKDAAHERETGGRGAYRTTPLLALQTAVEIGRGEPHPGWYAPSLLAPPSLIPRDRPSRDLMLEGYRDLESAFRDGFEALRKARTVDHFHQGLISFSERHLWSVPSSTGDEPDVSLHDHSLAVAAIACCLHRWHETDGSLEDGKRIRDRTIPKFRLLEGDLSGIQNTLFRLNREQVAGVNRILRGRSFLIGSIAEGAALLLRQELELPPYTVLLRAGGRFTMLLPAVDDIEERIAELQERIDRWLVRSYAGDLALNLALGEPFSGEGLLRGNWSATWRRFRARVEEAKLSPLASCMSRPVLGLALAYPEGADGSCRACGVMPRPVDGERCPACEAEQMLGRMLPKARSVFWKRRNDAGFALFDEIAVVAKDTFPACLEKEERAGFAISGLEQPDRNSALPLRFYANHVPTFEHGEWDDPRYWDVIEDEEEIDRLREDAIKTMAHLAQEDREQVGGRWVGRAMLAVLKADVDHLGQVFTRGFPERDRTIGRTVALSRLVDAFFSGWLPWKLRSDDGFRNIYTVYAGGDDLLLIGPWFTVLRFAVELRKGFEAFAAGNLNLTLSAGIEFVNPREPLNRAAARAEERLERAKAAAGVEKNRVCLIVEEPVRWPELTRALEQAERLNGDIREGRVSTGFVYRLLHFADMKARAERTDGPADLEAAMWNARFSYHLTRAFPKDERARERYRELIGRPGTEPPVPARIPLTIAIYRNR